MTEPEEKENPMQAVTFSASCKLLPQEALRYPLIYVP